MAMNGKLKNLLPYLAIVGVVVTMLTFSAKWGATTEKVQANERQIKMMDRRIADEFKKQEARDKEWRKRDADDRKRLERLMQTIINKMDGD